MNIRALKSCSKEESGCPEVNRNAFESSCVSFRVVGSNSDLVPDTISMHLITISDLIHPDGSLSSFLLGEKEHWPEVINSTMDLFVLIKNLLWAPDRETSRQHPRL